MYQPIFSNQVAFTMTPTSVPWTVQAQYRVTVITSNIRGAGTDANVFIQIYGDEGETGRINLDNPGR